jgi:type IV pilus assembly protein PilE
MAHKEGAPMSVHVAPFFPKARGFTLIEVMITVGIVAILAGIAVPAYTEYLRRGQLPEAHALLADYKVKMEQYYQDNRNYGVDNCALAGGVSPSWANFNPGARNFTFVCQLRNGGQAFTITATGNAASRANGHVYTINEQPGSAGRATTSFKGAAVAKPCWLVKGDEC